MTKIECQQLYIDFVLNKGHRPASVYSFAKETGMTEAEFYEFYHSFEALESQVMAGWMEKVEAALKEDATWQQYSARERLLAVYYGWIQELTSNRSFVKFVSDQGKPGLGMYQALKSTRDLYMPLIREIIEFGIQNGEIQPRKMISDKYAELLWMQVLFIYNFWMRDKSASFEKTDEAIERSTNLAFEMMQKSALDQAFDFAKFIYQTAV